MLDIIELEKVLLDAIATHTTSFTTDNIVLLPSNFEELPKPYLGIQTLSLPPTGRHINHPIDEITGEREVTQHYSWIVRFKAVGNNDTDRSLIVSSVSLAQELILKMSTYLFRAELECNYISLRSVGPPRRMPILIADEWVDQTNVDVIFGLADVTTEFISFIETVGPIQGEYLRGPNDPDPIVT